jgi:hypothetical protein
METFEKTRTSKFYFFYHFHFSAPFHFSAMKSSLFFKNVNSQFFGVLGRVLNSDLFVSIIPNLKLLLV